MHLRGCGASDCRNATKTSFRRSIHPGLEILEKKYQDSQHATRAASRPHNFCNHGKVPDFWILSPSIINLHNLDLQIARRPQSQDCLGILSEWKRHRTLSKPQSETPQVSYPKSVSTGLQSPQTSGGIPSTSPPYLADDLWTEMLPPEWLKLSLTWIAPAGAHRQNYDLIAETQLRPHSGDPSFQDWRCWRKWEHTTCRHGPHHIPTILQPSQNA